MFQLLDSLLPSLLVLAPALGAQDAEAPAKASETAPLARYVRLVEEGSEVQLQIAERHFVRAAGEGGVESPRVVLVAAMHVGEPAFYAALQKRLNGLDDVLFEGVGAAPLAVDVAAAGTTPASWAIAATRRRMRVAATLLARHRGEHGQYPELLNEVLPAADATPHGYDAVSDAWGRPLVYRVHPPAEAGGEATFALGSLGADGREGGERSARDLWFHEQRPVEEHETEGRKGIQQDLAVALGLVFQLDAMSDLSPKWRNVDATFTQVQDWLEDDGASLQLESLDGGSMLTSFMGRALRLIGFSDTMSGLVRMVGIEVLARAEALLQDPQVGSDPDTEELVRLVRRAAELGLQPAQEESPVLRAQEELRMIEHLCHQIDSLPGGGGSTRTWELGVARREARERLQQALEWEEAAAREAAGWSRNGTELWLGRGSETSPDGED